MGIKRNSVDMLSGSIFKGLFVMVIPIMIMNVTQNMFNLIDMTILGNFASDSAVGAVGTCGTLISVCTSLLIGISTGANVVVAKCIGSGDEEKTERAIGTAVLFSVVGGLILLALGVSCAEIFLGWINCPDELMGQASLYFRLYFIGAPMLLLYNFCASILRAGGDTKRPMYFLMIGSSIKVVLSYICLAKFHMTVEGVGIATIVCNTVIGGLAFITLLRNDDKTKFTFKKMRFYGSELKEILFIGVPTGLQTALYSVANSVIVATVNSFGPDATTGISIANQFDGILYQICHATCLATMPYVAQNIGAGNLSRTKKAIINSVLITVMFGAFFGLLSAAFSRQLSSLMTSTPAVIEYSRQKMIIISSTYFICGINEVLGGTLRGMGKPIIPTMATLFFMCLLRFVWVYLIFPLCPTMTFLYLVWPIGWILCIITELIAYFIAMSKLQKKQAVVLGC
ncbi:MAG: MATE family efflux transporter [Clostridia bacterium]|nr:MATE family efflux transporter [Clostridia bacterium]